MTTKLKISVVLCSCDGDAYLSEQLLTLLTQSQLPDEIIIGDDASVDRTWVIVEDFAAQARTRGIAVRAVRRPERLGYVANFSSSLGLASGDVIFLCDQDDAWHPDKIALMMDRFAAEPELTLLHTDARLVDAKGADIGNGLFDALELTETEREKVRSGRAFEVYLRRNLATGAATAFRRDLLDIALPVPSSWVHDAWLAAMASATGTVGLLDDPLVDYRQHGHNQIGMRSRTMRTRLAEIRFARGAHLRAEVFRLDALEERLSMDSRHDDVLGELSERRAHVRRRIELGQLSSLMRIPAVVREWMSGAYTRFGTGKRTALRDLLRRD